MTEDTTNLVLEHLRHMRLMISRIDEKLETVILRLSIIEGHVANFHVSEAAQNAELDRIKRRLDRVEHRLELAD
jgi:hypothetical protein